MLLLPDFIRDHSATILINLLSFTWQSSLVLLTGLTLNYFLRKMSPVVRHLILVSIVILLPLIPVVTYVLENNETIDNEYPSTSDILTFTAGEESIFFDSASINSENATGDTEKHSTENNLSNIVILSFLGFSFISLIKITLEKTIIDWKLRSAAKTDKKCIQTFAAAAAKLNLQRNYSVAYLPDINSPFTYGFFKPRIFIPEHLPENISENELEAIAYHELNHIYRNDAGINFILAIFKSLLFFNPFLWITVRQILSLAEQACDETAIRYSISEIEYAKLLTKLADAICKNDRNNILFAAFQQEDSNLYKRIKNILNSRRKNMREIPATLKLLIFIMVLGVVYGSTLLPIKVIAREMKNDTSSVQTSVAKNPSLVFAYEDEKNSLIFLQDDHELATVLDNMDHMYPLDPGKHFRVGSEFGHRKHPYSGLIKFHNGIDIVADEGENVLAFADGTVIEAEEKGDHGNLIIIRHDQELTTLYSHLSKIDVVKGQEVKKGQKIGSVGSTGLSTGSHLHFSLKCNKYYIDPHSLEVFKAELDSVN